MSYYALASLMETIKLEFSTPNRRVSFDDYTSLFYLFIKLNSIKKALCSKKFQGGSAVIRDLEIKIKDFALKIEDDIEMQLSNILQLENDTEFQDKARGKLDQTFREATEDAKELLNIINDTCNEVEGANNDTHPFIHWLKPASYPDNLVLGGFSRCTPELDDLMVGKEPRNFFYTTKALLLRTHHTRAVIPIVGMAGIGKTALARRVYEDPLVASNFDVKAWATVSHEYNLQQILYDLLHSMTPTVRISEGSTLFQLKKQLCKHLKDKRYFIVLDDVWSIQDYNDIKKCFPNDPCGSCILLTAMSQGLAVGCRTHMTYRIQFLNKDECWELFCKRLSFKEHMMPKFEEIAKHVVNQCEGLPRSVVAVAECLSKCKYTLKEWRKVKKEIDALGPLYRDVKYSSKLTLIYNQMPPYLKVYFLYFALFPKGSEVQGKKLLRLWIAEGLIEPSDHKSIEEMANMFLCYLFGKCLVLITRLSYDCCNRTYRMHGALHSFCVREAKKEGLFCAVDTRQCLGWSLNMLSNSFRWLSLYSHKLDYYVFFSTNKPRSVFFFRGDIGMFEPFKLLRILDLSPALMLKSVPLCLKDLVFLRYLSVPKWSEVLDDVIGSNRNLQTLIISSVKSKHGPLAHNLSGRVWELPQLCHLELGNMYTVDPPSMDKEHLETLSWVSPIHFRKEVHYKFPNLRKLKIFYKDVVEPNDRCESCRNSIIILENIEYLSRLETLKVIVPIASITLVERSVFPAQLKKLCLRGTNLPMHILRVISQLQYLESLKLENAFYSRVWEVVEGDFPKLESLFIEDRNLVQWAADANHFPNLKKLLLRRCYCLEEIPLGFAEIPKLWIIDLEQCPRRVVISALRIHAEAKNKANGRLDVSVDGIHVSDQILMMTNTEEPTKEE